MQIHLSLIHISHKGETLSWDLQITGLFIIVNFIYYLLWEWIFLASLGKFLCGLTVSSDNNQPTTEKEIIKRCFLLLLLMIAAVGLRFTDVYKRQFLNRHALLGSGTKPAQPAADKEKKLSLIHIYWWGIPAQEV